MQRTNFETLDVYRLAEKLADEIWTVVATWDRFARETVGMQMVRAANSIGANIAEGTGRGSFQDNRRFVRTARSSLYETRHWLRRAFARSLLSPKQIESLKPIVDELSPKLNAYLKSIGNVTPQRTTDNGQRTHKHGHCHRSPFRPHHHRVRRPYGRNARQHGSAAS